MQTQKCVPLEDLAAEFKLRTQVFPESIYVSNNEYFFDRLTITIQWLTDIKNKSVTLNQLS